MSEQALNSKYVAYPEYKESGVEWLGQIPSHWLKLPLKRHCSVSGGYAFPSESFGETGTPVIRIGDILYDGSVSLHNCKYIEDGDSIAYAKYRVVAGDLLMAMTGATIGKAGWYREKEAALLNQRVGSFKVEPTILKKFVWYVLASAGYQEHIRLTAFGGAQPNISDTGMLAYETAFPPIEEQRTIAAFLDYETARIDSLIDKQQRLIELLKEKRQAVISHAVTKGLNPDAPMKDSGVEWLGQVPEHWAIAQLKFNTLTMQTGPFGSQLHAEDYVDGGIPLVNPAHMSNGNIVPDPQVSVDLDTQERLGRHKLKEGDIIFARRGELGRCAVVKAYEVGWLCGTGSLKATLNERLIPEYAYLLITSDGVIAELSLESKGSTMDNLNTETLGKVRIPVPPISEQREILVYVEDVSGKFKELVEKAEIAIKLMQERRTALISAAVTGKIDLRGWTQPVKEDAA
ncbi:restriction endonuclease subunit S [Shewanella algae]|uniref:restriction endonuclease subunit S n=1 Tax=Shewanella algae TaxID=38313 RepID=UPI0031F57AE4